MLRIHGLNAAIGGLTYAVKSASPACLFIRGRIDAGLLCQIVIVSDESVVYGRYAIVGSPVVDGAEGLRNEVSARLS